MAEGVRTVEVLIDSPLQITGVLHTRTVHDGARGDALLTRLQAIGVPTQEVSVAELQSAADTESPQGILAVATVPRYSLPPSTTTELRLLVLDALQDPGNVGTIIRTAAAFGVTATVALPGTVDFWNAKVVRSSMGALFGHPVLSLTWPELEQYLVQGGVPLWVADAHGQPVNKVDGVPSRLALVVGNEGAGLTPSLVAHAAQQVAIPISASVESLNVAVATGILLYALAPHSPS